MTTPQKLPEVVTSFSSAAGCNYPDKTVEKEAYIQQLLGSEIEGIFAVGEYGKDLFDYLGLLDNYDCYFDPVYGAVQATNRQVGKYTLDTRLHQAGYYELIITDTNTQVSKTLRVWHCKVAKDEALNLDQAGLRSLAQFVEFSKKHKVLFDRALISNESRSCGVIALLNCLRNPEFERLVIEGLPKKPGDEFFASLLQEDVAKKLADITDINKVREKLESDPAFELLVNQAILLIADRYYNEEGAFEQIKEKLNKANSFREEHKRQVEEHRKICETVKKTFPENLSAALQDSERFFQCFEQEFSSQRNDDEIVRKTLSAYQGQECSGYAREERPRNEYGLGNNYHAVLVALTTSLTAAKAGDQVQQNLASAAPNASQALAKPLPKPKHLVYPNAHFAKVLPKLKKKGRAVVKRLIAVQKSPSISGIKKFNHVLEDLISSLSRCNGIVSPKKVFTLEEVLPSLDTLFTNALSDLKVNTANYSQLCLLVRFLLDIRKDQKELLSEELSTKYKSDVYSPSIAALSMALASTALSDCALPEAFPALADRLLIDTIADIPQGPNQADTVKNGVNKFLRDNDRQFDLAFCDALSQRLNRQKKKSQTLESLFPVRKLRSSPFSCYTAYIDSAQVIDPSQRFKNVKYVLQKAPNRYWTKERIQQALGACKISSADRNNPIAVKQAKENVIFVLQSLLRKSKSVQRLVAELFVSDDTPNRKQAHLHYLTGELDYLPPSSTTARSAASKKELLNVAKSVKAYVFDNDQVEKLLKPDGLIVYRHPDNLFETSGGERDGVASQPGAASQPEVAASQAEAVRSSRSPVRQTQPGHTVKYSDREIERMIREFTKALCAIPLDENGRIASKATVGSLAKGRAKTQYCLDPRRKQAWFNYLDGILGSPLETGMETLIFVIAKAYREVSPRRRQLIKDYLDYNKKKASESPDWVNSPLGQRILERSDRLEEVITQADRVIEELLKQKARSPQAQVLSAIQQVTSSVDQKPAVARACPNESRAPVGRTADEVGAGSDAAILHLLQAAAPPAAAATPPSSPSIETSRAGTPVGARDPAAAAAMAQFGLASTPQPPPPPAAAQQADIPVHKPTMTAH